MFFMKYGYFDEKGNGENKTLLKQTKKTKLEDRHPTRYLKMQFFIFVHVLVQKFLSQNSNILNALGIISALRADSENLKLLCNFNPIGS